MMLRAAKTPWLPVPFKRDQIERLLLPKMYDSTAARRDYNFSQSRPFLTWRKEKTSYLARIPTDKGLDRITEPVYGAANVLFHGREVF